MGEDKIYDEKTQKALIKLLKKQELNFVFGLGKSPADNVLLFDKRKNGKILFGMVKATKEGVSKGAWGSATAEGKVLKLQCEKELPGLKRQVKTMFPKQPKWKGLVSKVDVFRADGEAIVEPGDEELDQLDDGMDGAIDDSEETAEREEEGGGDPQAEEYARRWQALAGDLATVVGEKRGDTGKIDGIAKLAESKSTAKDWKSALQSLTALETLVRAALAGDAFPRRWKALEPNLTLVLKKNLGDTSKIQGVAKLAQSKNRDGDAKAALQAVDALEKLLVDAKGKLLIEREGESHIQEEWDRREELEGELKEGTPHPDDGLPKVLRTDKMFSVRDGVNAPMNWEDVSKGELGVAQERLAFERKATEWMRGNLTKKLNKRSGSAKESLTSNCDMAGGLGGILEKHPELLEKDGLLSRIVGPVEGQGQHKSTDKPEDVVTKIKDAAARLKSGKGEGEDGNLVLQFIGCFTDGLTEVIEGREKAKNQLDLIWPDFCDAFGVAPENQESFKQGLLKRVSNYKAIAGGRSDTLSGKGKRKDKTREGINPEDPRLRLTEHDALIKGDVSGSVHSCFLAYEIAEILKDPTGMDVEDDVLLTDRKLIDARVLDALSLTAGGKKAPGKIAKENQDDLVFHTAYEMLNGLRGITGAPAITQDQATQVMEFLWKDRGYTQAMESLFPEQRFAWMSEG